MHFQSHLVPLGNCAFVMLVLVVAAPLLGKSEAGTATLAAGGKPTATILVPAAAGKIVAFAASELQKYVAQISGATLPIVNDVTETSGPRLLLTSPESSNAYAVKLLAGKKLPTSGADGFLLLSSGDNIVIAGGCDRAVLFAVYDLLERLGCRWFGPGEEFVPHTAALSVPALDISETPTFQWRAFELIAGSNGSVADWMAKVKLNVTWPEGYAPNTDLTVSPRNMQSQGIPAMIQRGATIFWGGHILPWLFPIDKYKDHPEYFALIKGKRLDPAEDVQNQNQLCTSHPDVLRILSENTVDFLRQHPWIDVLFLWGGDTTQWCECDKCLALQPISQRKSAFGPDRSVLYCRMIRAVSDAVQKALPDRKIAFNHYYNLENLPTDAEGRVLESVLPSDHVLSAVDEYSQCIRHPLRDQDCPRGKRIPAIAKMWAPYYKDSVTWSYYFAWNFTRGLPLSMVHKIPDDFRLVRSLGINGVVDNVTLRPGSIHWHNSLLNFYIYAKAAWNPDLNVEQVVSDYVKWYYGPAAQPMAKAWKLIDEATRKFGLDPDFMPDDPVLRTSNVIHDRMHGARAPDAQLFIPNRRVYEELMGYLREAERLAAFDSGQTYLNRVAILTNATAAWETEKQRLQIFGFLNGGGEKLYSFGKETHCTVVDGSNRGDCFWTKPVGTEQLFKIGDSYQIRVKVNVGADVVGSAIYRSGPGLYQAHDQTAPCGGPNCHSATLFIGNLTDDQVQPKRVIAMQQDGGWETKLKSSGDNVWKYGQYVTLRIDYVSAADGKHTYRYLYDAGSGWTDLGTLECKERMPFVGPCFWFTTCEEGKTKYPIVRWASFAESTSESKTARPD